MKRRNQTKSKKLTADGNPQNHISAADHPACGMWADREDMKDVEAWLRRLRAPRYSFGPGGPIRKPDRPKPVRGKS
jgi:hypothetical protein